MEMKTFLKYFLIVISLAFVSIVITFLLRIPKNEVAVKENVAAPAGSSKSFPEIGDAERDEVAMVVPKNDQKTNNQDVTNPLAQQEKESEKNEEVMKVLQEIKKNYALDNLSDIEVTFKWLSGQAKSNTVDGEGFIADSNLLQGSDIEQFLREEGFSSSDDNSRDDDKTKTNGFEKDGLVCLVTKTTEQENSGFDPINEQIKIEVRCGMLGQF